MAISRWDPFRDLSSIQNELNRLFGRTFAREGEAEAEARDVAWTPALDVSETQDRFVIQVELPGVAPEDVDISVENSMLTVQGERRFYNEMKEDDFVRVERRFGSFARSITLPSTADPEAIQASFDAGVLTIEVPKKEEAKPRKIQIQAKG
jgi:HSP20 family protein